MRSPIRRGLAAAILLSACALAQAQDTVRPDVAQALQAAQTLIREGKPQDALARLREAEAQAAGGRTAYETYLIQRVRGSAAAAAGDDAAAQAAFDAVLASGRLQGPERLDLLEALAGMAFRRQDYRQAIAHADQHAADGGRSARLARLKLNAHHLNGDHATVVRLIQARLPQTDAATLPVDETTLRMLAASQAQTKDDAGYLETLALLLRHHPRHAYWADALPRIARMPDLLERHGLDYLRLCFAVRTFDQAQEYVDLAQRVLQAGVPAEALRVLDAGFAAGLLGKGPEADRHQRLRERARRQVDEDRAGLKVAVAGRPPEAALATGLALVSLGRATEGLPLMEQAVANPVLKRPDDGRLQLGQAYLAAGRADQAAASFGAIGGQGPAALLARFWRLHALAPDAH